MRKLILLSIILNTAILNAQIGVKVELPLTDLHVNGDIQIDKDLKVGGGKTVIGNSGIEGQVLVSRGEGLSPQWGTLNIPVVLPETYTLVKSSVFVDKTGIELHNPATKRRYTENENLSDVPANDPNAIWHVFPELTNEIIITQEFNKINFTIQTLSHLSSQMKEDSKAEPRFTYAIGIFINGKLKAVKAFVTRGTADTFSIVTLISTIEDLPIGKHLVQIAAIPRLKERDYLGFLAIGKPNSNSNNITQFMANSSFKIDIFEKIN